MNEAAFMAEILAHPEDDAPRLLLADFWDENDQPERAEFVRVQCALTRTPQFLPMDECEVCGSTANEEGERRHGRGCYILEEDGGGSDFAEENPQWEDLRRREREILNANGFNWTKGLIGTPWAVSAHENGLVLLEFGKPNMMGGAYFRWGLVEALTCPAADWLAHADALTTAAPIREVRLTTWPVLNWEDRPFERDHRYWLPGRTLFHTLTDIEISNVPASAAEAFRRNRVSELLRAEWPRIDFTLAPVVASVAWENPSPDIVADLRAVRDEIARRMGIPPEIYRGIP